MLLTLKPESHSELSDIVVTSGYLAIGRRELPFSQYAQEIADTLSRRHARLFSQNDRFHVVDLGSSNGTTVNGKEVTDQPLRLNNGDVVTFADHLSYKVDIGVPEQDQPTRYIQKNNVPLHLVLASKNPALETIVVKKFPFLISKDDPVFSRYEKTEPEEVAFLSRKHAYIFQVGDNFFIEELGSTNGTFLNSERLDEKAQQLNRGSTLSFGGDYFLYEIHPGGSDLQSSSGHEKTPGDDPRQAFALHGDGKTTFIDSATSFLDIFCLLDEPQAALSDSPNKADAAGPNGKTHSGLSSDLAEQPKRGSLKKTWDKFQVTVNSWTDGIRDWRVFTALLVVVPAVIFIVAQLFDGEKDDIEALCSAGPFEACAVRATAYLGSHELADKNISKWVTQALLTSVVPEWLTQLQKSDFKSANKIMSEAQALVTPGSERAEIIALLQEISGIEQYISQRGGPDGAIRMFAHEGIIKDILKQWDKDRGRIVMTRIVQAVPDFEAVRQRVQSRIRLLRSDNSRYLSAIAEFKARLKPASDQGRSAVTREVDRFVTRFPRVSGIDDLRDDLDQYYRIIDSDTDPVQQLQQFGQVSFKTPLVQQWVATLKDEVLPPEDISRVLQTAREQWQQGQLAAMEQSLQEITAAPWQDYAARWIQRSRKIDADYDSLKSSEGKTGYEQQLSVFRASLDPDRDLWFFNATAEQYTTYRKRAVKQAGTLSETATRNWRRYLKAGGLQTRERLDDRVSKEFRQKASLLARAWHAADEAGQLAQGYGIALTADELSVWKDIKKERRLQLGSIRDLEGILKAEVISNKLKLLQGVQPG